MVFDAGTGGASPSRNPLRVIPTAAFAKQVATGRWFTVFASLLILTASGATYIFSVYSRALKESLGYDQKTLNTVSFFKDLGANLGVFSGLINEVTPPWVVLAIGAAMNLFGYLMVYLAVAGKTSTPPVWLLCLYVFVGANSQSFANTGALVTCVKNFPEGRGVVLGILKGFVGLSGAVYTQLYLAFYGDDAKSLILLIAWLPAAMSVVFVHTVRILPYPRRRGGYETSSDPFFCFLYISIGLACYLLVMIVVQRQFEFSSTAYSCSAAALLIILCLPLCVVIKYEYKIHCERLDLAAAEPPPSSIAVVQLTETEKHPPPPNSSSSPSPAAEKGNCLRNCFGNMFRPPARGDDYTITQALVSIDMIVLFIATICGVGGTLTAIDNMGQIGQSLGYPSKSINTFVSLISIWNYAGRVTAGFASEALLDRRRRRRIPRPLVLTAVLILACAGHLLIAFGVSNSLYAASVIIGFCFGAQWPLVFAIISELFGLKYYSTLYNFGGMASPVGSYVLNVLVAGRLYDKEAERHPGGGAGGGRDRVCVGVDCFKRSFLVITAATAFGALVSLVLVWRTWGFYKGDIYARFRDGGGAGEGDVDHRRPAAAEGEEESTAVNGRKE